MKKLPRLHKLTTDDLFKIASNVRLTNHAKEQVKKRLGIDIYNYDDRMKFKNMIRHSKLAYVNTDEAINIAFSEHTYLVVSQDSLPTYVAITFKEPSHNSYTVQEKYELALQGVER